MSLIHEQNFESGTDSPPTDWTELVDTNCDVVWNESLPGNPPPGLGEYCISATVAGGSDQYAVARYTAASAQSDNYWMFYFYISQEGLATGEYIQPALGQNSSNANRVYLQVKDNDGTGDLRVRLTHYHDGGWVYPAYSSASLSINTWYFAKVYYTASTAGYKIYSCDNGSYTLVDSYSGSGYTTGDTILYFRGGITWTTASAACKVYFDAFKWGTTSSDNTPAGVIRQTAQGLYIGPRESGHTPCAIATPDGVDGFVLFESFQGPNSGADNSGWNQDLEGSGVLNLNYSDTHNGGTEVLRAYHASGANSKCQLNRACNYSQLRVRWYMYLIGATGYWAKDVLRLRNNTSSTFLLQVEADNDSSQARVRVKGCTSGGTYTSSWLDVSNSTWLRYELRYISGGSCWVKVWDASETTIGSWTATSVDVEEFQIGGCDKNLAEYFDARFNDIFIRNASVNDNDIGDWSVADDVLNKDDDTYYFDSTKAVSTGVRLDHSNSIPDQISNTSIIAVREYFRTCGRATDSYKGFYGSMLSTNKQDDWENGQTLKNKYILWLENPWLENPWNWSNLEDVDQVARTSVNITEIAGFKLSGAWRDIISATSDAGIVTHGPIFGGVTDSSIRVWVRVSGANPVYLLYGTNEATVRAGTGSTSATMTPSSDDNYCVVFEITGLSANQTYYFDVYVKQNTDVYTPMSLIESVGYDDFWQTNLPSCKTFPAEDSSVDFNFTAAGDIHGTVEPTTFHHMATHNPVVFFQLGDEHPDPANDALESYRESALSRRGLHGFSVDYLEPLLMQYPFCRIWSDHDHLTNNGHKIGEGRYDTGPEPKECYNALKAFKENTPLYDLEAPNDWDQTDSSGVGGSATTLTDSKTPERQFTYSSVTGGTPVVGDSVSWNSGTDTGTLIYYDSDDKIMILQLDDNTSVLDSADVVTNGTWSTSGSLSNIYTFPKAGKYGIYPGQVVRKITGTRGNTGASEYAIVRNNTGTTIHFCEALSGSESFATPDPYLIQRGGLWHTFKIANVLFIVVDIRYKRDPNRTPGGDKFDGTVYGFVNNNLSKDLDGDGDYGDSCTATGSSTTTHIYTTGQSFTTYLCEGDLVENVTDGEYGLIKTIHDDNHIELCWAMTNSPANDTIRFYESGLSEHGSDKANIEAGHVQRTWVKQLLESSAGWKILVSETPLMHGEIGNWDKWCDYDGMTYIGDNLNWDSYGSGLLIKSQTTYSSKPGGVFYMYNASGNRGPFREVASTSDFDGNCDENKWMWNSADNTVVVKAHSGLGWTKTVANVTATTLTASSANWDNDQHNGRTVVIMDGTAAGNCYDVVDTYDGDTLSFSGVDLVSDGVSVNDTFLILIGSAYIYHPNFWWRCAMRRFIVENFQNQNVIWLGADRHFAAIDDASNDADPWPHIFASPLGRGVKHLSCREAVVDNKAAWYHAGMSAGYDGDGESDTPVGWALLEVKNSEDMVSVSLRERDGTIINNSTNNDGFLPDDYSGWLGNLEMDVIFASVLIDEGFEGTGTEETWTETVN